MSDRELLELAAKAAGIEIHQALQAKRDEDGYGDSGLWIVNGSTCWNPLTDDGDALRLAVTLGLVVDCSRPSAALPFRNHDLDLSEGGNNTATTRRCIVRAAAEIGKKEQP